MDHLYACINFIITRKKLLWILTALFFIGLGVSVVYRGGFEVSKRTDLTVYLRAAEAINAKENIYEVQNSRGWNYLYLPLLAILLSPFTNVPLPLMVFLWYLLSLAALGAVIFLSCKIAPEKKNAFLLAAAAYTFTLPSFVNTLARGQLGIFPIFFAVLVFYFYLKERPAAAGLSLALGVTLKISPLGFCLFYFLFKKEWRVCVWAFLGFILFLWIFPSFWIGAKQNAFLLGEWLRIMKEATASRPYESHLWSQAFTFFAEDNQSLYAVAMRAVWHSEQNFLGASSANVQWVIKIMTGFALFLLGFGVLRGKEKTNLPRLLAEYSLFPMLMLLVSPVSEMHHFTILFLPFLAGLLLAEQLSKSPATRRCLMLSIWGAYFFYLAGLLFPWACAWGLPAAGALLLFLAVAGALFGTKSCYHE